MLIYSKNTQENLKDEEKKILKGIINEIKKS